MGIKTDEVPAGVKAGFFVSQKATAEIWRQIMGKRRQDQRPEIQNHKRHRELQHTSWRNISNQARGKFLLLARARHESAG